MVTPLEASPSIALCLIVKDEAHVIGRCLESAVGLVDEVVVIDTGSTDSTQSVISEVCAANYLRLVMDERPWSDFGHNRSELMELARLESSADYLLLVDADMTVNVKGPFTERHPAMMVEHEGEGYWNRRLVWRDLPWRYVGRTHEVLVRDDEDDAPTPRCESISITHHEDGSSRAVKFERDLALLRQDIEDGGGNARAWFYLAQTMECLGMAEAVDAYRARALMGGFEEERWLAVYRAARLTWDPVAMFKAHCQRPTRAEPLLWLARYHRNLGQYQVGMIFASAMGMPVPDDISFVEREGYEWGLALEYGICAWHCGMAKEAAAVFADLLALDLPDNVRAMVETNAALC